MAFPNDFNWLCPRGHENRAFQFPRENGKYKEIVTTEELETRCQECEHEKFMQS